MPTYKITRDDRGNPVVWKKEGTDDKGRGDYRKIKEDGSKGARAKFPKDEKPSQTEKE